MNTETYTGEKGCRAKIISVGIKGIQYVQVGFRPGLTCESAVLVHGEHGRRLGKSISAGYYRISDREEMGPD